MPLFIEEIAPLPLMTRKGRKELSSAHQSLFTTCFRRDSFPTPIRLISPLLSKRLPHFLSQFCCQLQQDSLNLECNIPTTSMKGTSLSQWSATELFDEEHTFERPTQILCIVNENKWPEFLNKKQPEFIHRF